MLIEGLEQQTPEWLQMRCGMATASRIAQTQSFLTRKSKNGDKGEETAARKAYRYDLAIEMLTGRTVDTYVSQPMEWGIDNEPLARAAYEMATDVEVELVGFAIHDVINRFGASPDGLIGSDGLIEIKCPTTATHIDYLLAGVVPEEYQPQMLAEMACTGRQWCDFVSFDPRLPKELQLFIRHFKRDQKRITELEDAVMKFLGEVDDLLTRLKQEDPSSLEGALRQSLEAVTK
jgi:putative phage-type endonuclease